MTVETLQTVTSFIGEKLVFLWKTTHISTRHPKTECWFSNGTKLRKNLAQEGSKESMQCTNTLTLSLVETHTRATAGQGFSIVTIGTV
jgi:hypothetical protein